MSLFYRKSTVLKANSSDSTRPDFASSYTVTVYPPGAFADGAQSGVSAVTVHAGHGVTASDKILVGGTNFYDVDSVTATTITVSSGTVTVTDGQVIVNLGADGGSSAPDWDGSTVDIFSAPDEGGSAISNSSVSTSATGEYEYWTTTPYIWELVRTGNLNIEVTPFVVTAKSFETTPSSSTDNAVVRFDGVGGDVTQNSGVTVDDSNNMDVPGSLTVGGALNHDGSTVGLFGVMPSARPSAYTQTYATASKTVTSPSSLAAFRPMGEMYFSGNAVVTTITTIDTWTQIQISATDGHLDSFDTPSVYELRYTGATTTPFHLGCTLSFSSASNNQSATAVLVKNATVNGNNEYSTGKVLSGGTIRTKVGTAGDVVSTAIHIMEGLATNDTLSLFVKNTAGTADLTIIDMNLFGVGITQDLADDITEVKQILNSLIDDLQSLGIVQ